MTDHNTDNFGLPLGIDDNETLEQQIRRRAEVEFKGEIALARLFGRLKFHLGLAQAQSMFRPWGMRSKRGRPKGSAHTHGNLAILSMREDMMRNGETSPDLIAAKIYETSQQYGMQLGNSPKAIEQKIRELLRQEVRQQREQAERKAALEELARLPQLAETAQRSSDIDPGTEPPQKED